MKTDFTDPFNYKDRLALLSILIALLALLYFLARPHPTTIFVLPDAIAPNPCRGTYTCPEYFRVSLPTQP